MWSKARCLAALDGRLPDAVTVEVAFKKPVLLPGTVLFGSARRDAGYAFALSRPQDGKPHLLGRFGPAHDLTHGRPRASCPGGTWSSCSTSGSTPRR